MLLAFADESPLAHALAREMDCELAFIETHRFPDGEIKLRLPPALPPRVVVLRGLQQPNDRLVQLLLAGRTARELGARHLTLASPYLAYMRQDMAFQPGEAVSQRHVGQALAAWFDAVITVDPHLHREVALKALHLVGDQTEAATAMLHEARAVSRLTHPNIVPVHALGCDHEGLPLLVMKRVDGAAWRDLLEQAAASGLWPGAPRQIRVTTRKGF